MSNLTHTYSGLNPGLSALEKTAVGLGVNANAIDYAPTLLAEDVPIPPTFDEGQTDVPVVIPDDTWLKADIAAWLDDKGIAYSSSATKAELLALVPVEG